MTLPDPARQPLPIAIFACDTCGEPWARHEQYRDVDDDRDPFDDGPPLPGQNPVSDNPLSGITLLTCIRVLQDKNLGPIGPPGPMGPMGHGGSRFRSL